MPHQKPAYHPVPPRHKRPVLLDLPLDQLMALLARTVDTSVSQLANFFIAYGAMTYLTDEDFRQLIEAHRTYARSMKFLWNLHLPAAWLTLIQEALPEEVNDGQKA